MIKYILYKDIMHIFIYSQTVEMVRYAISMKNLLDICGVCTY